MPFNFANGSAGYWNAPGSLFVGVDGDWNEIGIKTERHAITVAGAGSGKGVGFIIPNLLRWPHNVLCIDPKGENAEQSWRAREAMGQRVVVVDPFKRADVPERLRVSVNLLSEINPNSFTAREDIRVIADGLVMRYKAEDGMWDNGAVSMLAGVIAHVSSADGIPTDRKNLAAVRDLLNASDDVLEQAFTDMRDNPACGGLAQSAGVTGLTAIKSSKGKAKEYLSSAQENIEWCGSPAMRTALAGQPYDPDDIKGVMLGMQFRLAYLKTMQTSLFIVLPPEYLDEHSRFLRVFVRAALDAMAKPAPHAQRCLFLLDEFAALGRINEIAKAAGLMRSYGVQLWPFLQDLGQLVTLYGREGAETFFGNSDAHIFFGNNDAPSLDYVSHRLGVVAHNEMPPPPERYGYTGHVASDSAFASWARNSESLHNAYEESKMRTHAHNMAQLGRPRMPPDEVREFVSKPANHPVALRAIIFARGRDVLAPYVTPYWVDLDHARVNYAAPRHEVPALNWHRVKRAVLAIFVSILAISGVMILAIRAVNQHYKSQGAWFGADDQQIFTTIVVTLIVMSWPVWKLFKKIATS